MRLAVLSDIHDHLQNLERALAQVRSEGAEALIFCGDLCAPFTLVALGEGYPGPVDVVFGNNDGDRFLILQNAAKLPHVTVHGEVARLELDSQRILVHHFTDIALELAHSGRYDAIFCGHTHRYQLEQIGAAIVLNPGEIMGRFGEPGWALYDTRTRRVTRVRLGS